jgi:hypothetical protein
MFVVRIKDSNLEVNRKEVLIKDRLLWILNSIDLDISKPP